ncbi:MAG: sodium:calcium symporter [Ectothiorhodospiraceae bacterium]|nr:sodium:calcium symporter [Ectothiorhodospiraceae bacterium]
MQEEREQWGSRFGLILAVAGNAIGLGNFLRFPGQAASNGGGAFMIPYFIAFLLLGIPLMWVEWGIGRHGGKFGHSSTPGMFDLLWKNRFAKYLGVMGLVISIVIMIYYTYIESWTLGYSVFSMLGSYSGMADLGSMDGFLKSYQGLNPDGYFSSIWTAYAFMIVTFIINFTVLWKGLSGGIEKLAKYAMPLLFIFAVILVIRVFTLGTPDPAFPDQNVWKGFSYIWNPDLSKLGDIDVWLAATGQIFFTLSVGMGTIHAYASYLRPKDDIALSGLTTASTNGFVEIVLGGSIAIPVAVAYFGVAMTQDIAAGGTFNIGFVSMPVIFDKMPAGGVFGSLWFLLLFIAGITSSVAMAQPVIAFLKDEFRMPHKRAVLTVAALVFICVQPVVFFLGDGFLDEMDYWAGDFGLVVFATVEIFLFAWIFKIDNAWNEINEGADIKIPMMFKYIIKYVTPVYLVVLLLIWFFQKALDKLLLTDAAPEQVPYIWGVRALFAGLVTLFCILISKAWKRRKLAAAKAAKE